MLQRLGGVRLVPPNETSPVPGVLEYGRPFVLAPSPARDDRYFPCRFYWPDIVDPAFPERCQELVTKFVMNATHEEKAALFTQAEQLVGEARKRALPA